MIITLPELAGKIGCSPTIISGKVLKHIQRLPYPEIISLNPERDGEGGVNFKFFSFLSDRREFVAIYRFLAFPNN